MVSDTRHFGYAVCLHGDENVQVLARNGRVLDLGLSQRVRSSGLLFAATIFGRPNFGRLFPELAQG